MKAEVIEENSIERINLLNEYLKLSTQGFNGFKNKNYQESAQFYAKSLNISKKLGEIKQTESLINLAVSLFHLGKLSECYDNLETAFRIGQKLYNNDISNLPEITFLFLRVCCNATLINLTLSKTKEAVEFNKQTISVIEKEPNPELKVLLFKELLMIYFHIETSLEEYYEELHNSRQEEDEDENDDEEEEKSQKKMKSEKTNAKSKTLLLIHNFLRDGDFTGWIKLLEENIPFFKENSNIPAYIFSVLNSSVFTYIQTGKMDQTKTQLTNIIKSLKINGKLKSSEKILNEWKDKIECAIEIYRDILTLEESISEKYLNKFDYEALDEKIKTNSLFIKILLKHSLRYLEQNDDLDRNIKTQLESTLKSINKREVDLSRIDILSYDSEIINSIHILFNNLATIRKRIVLLCKFKQFVLKTTGSEDLNDFRTYYNQIIRYRGLKLFKENAVKAITSGKIIITKGDSFLKINFSSQGKVEHFYKINEQEKALYVYNSKTSKSANKYYFDKDIFQIRYGVKTKNLVKRYKDFKTPQLKQPWLYLSFQMAKSSIDLFMKDDQIVNWMFGMNELIQKNSWNNVMIMTSSGFVVKKFKLRMINRLKEELIEDEKTDEKDNKFAETQSKKASGIKKDMLIVTQIKKFLKLNPLGLDQLSFAKVLLLYIKIFEIKINDMPSKD